MLRRFGASQAIFSTGYGSNFGLVLSLRVDIELLRLSLQRLAPGKLLKTARGRWPSVAGFLLSGSVQDEHVRTLGVGGGDDYRPDAGSGDGRFKGNFYAATGARSQRAGAVVGLREVDSRCSDVANR